MALRLGKLCGNGPRALAADADGARPLAPRAHPPRRPRPHPDPPRGVRQAPGTGRASLVLVTTSSAQTAACPPPISRSTVASSYDAIWRAFDEIRRSFRKRSGVGPGVRRRQVAISRTRVRRWCGGLTGTSTSSQRSGAARRATLAFHDIEHFRILRCGRLSLIEQSHRYRHLAARCCIA